MSAYIQDGRVAVAGDDTFYLMPYALVGDARMTHRVSKLGGWWVVLPVREGNSLAIPPMFDTADEAIASVLGPAV